MNWPAAEWWGPPGSKLLARLARELGFAEKLGNFDTTKTPALDPPLPRWAVQIIFGVPVWTFCVDTSATRAIAGGVMSAGIVPNSLSLSRRATYRLPALMFSPFVSASSSSGSHPSFPPLPISCPPPARPVSYFEHVIPSGAPLWVHHA